MSDDDDVTLYPLVQIWSDIATRETFGTAVSDGRPVLIQQVDADITHYLHVPTVKAIIIPLTEPKNTLAWTADYCELCRRLRAFRPMDGYEYDMPKWF